MSPRRVHISNAMSAASESDSHHDQLAELRRLDASVREMASRLAALNKETAKADASARRVEHKLGLVHAPFQQSVYEYRVRRRRRDASNSPPF